MNNELHLYIAPSQITAEDWASAYAETVKLAQAAHFFDIGYSEEEGQEYAFAIPVAHKPWCHGENGEFGGWESYGDATCSCMPSKMFGLSDDLAAYTTLPPVGTVSKCGTALKKLIASGVPVVDLWAGKATDQPSIRLPLLGIATTICDRFPHATTLGGRIGTQEYNCAKKWATDILEGKTGRQNAANESLQNSNPHVQSSHSEAGWAELATTVDDGRLKYPVSEETVTQLLIHVLRRIAPTLYAQFKNLTRTQKIQEIVRYTLLKPLFPKSVWEYIFVNLDNPEVMERYVALMQLRTDNAANKDFVRKMLWNPERFSDLWSNNDK